MSSHDPNDPFVQFCASIGHEMHPEDKYSGEVIHENCDAAWGIAGFGVAHYFRRSKCRQYFTAVCGGKVGVQGLTFEAGTFPLCKRCLKLKRRWAI